MCINNTIFLGVDVPLNLLQDQMMQSSEKVQKSQEKHLGFYRPGLIC